MITSTKKRRGVTRVPITKGGTKVMRAAANCHQLRTAPKLLEVLEDFDFDLGDSNSEDEIMRI